MPLCHNTTQRPDSVRAASVVYAADTRAKRLRVTDRGARLAKRAVATAEKVDAAFFAPVPHPERLLAMLRPLAGHGERS